MELLDRADDLSSGYSYDDDYDDDYDYSDYDDEEADVYVIDAD